MKYTIRQTAQGELLDVDMVKGDKIYGEGGSFIVGKGAFEITSESGDLMSSLSRTFGGGESLFFTTITATGNAKVTLGSAYPTSLGKITLKNETYLLGDGVYLAHSGDIKVGAKFGGLSSFFAGSGLFFSKVEGTGDVFICGYGGITKVDVKEGEYILLDNGNFAAVHADAKLEKVKLGKSFLSSFLSTEGIGFKIYGPTTVYYRNSSPRNFILKFLGNFKSKLL